MPMDSTDSFCQDLTFCNLGYKASVLVQVGGGPTGVELAAEMHDYITEDFSHMFPSLKVCCCCHC